MTRGISFPWELSFYYSMLSFLWSAVSNSKKKVVLPSKTSTHNIKYLLTTEETKKIDSFLFTLGIDLSMLTR